MVDSWASACLLRIGRRNATALGVGMRVTPALSAAQHDDRARRADSHWCLPHPPAERHGGGGDGAAPPARRLRGAAHRRACVAGVARRSRRPAGVRGPHARQQAVAGACRAASTTRWHARICSIRLQRFGWRRGCARGSADDTRSRPRVAAVSHRRGCACTMHQQRRRPLSACHLLCAAPRAACRGRCTGGDTRARGAA